MHPVLVEIESTTTLPSSIINPPAQLLLSRSLHRAAPHRTAPRHVRVQRIVQPLRTIGPRQTPPCFGFIHRPFCVLFPVHSVSCRTTLSHQSSFPPFRLTASDRADFSAVPPPPPPRHPLPPASPPLPRRSTSPSLRTRPCPAHTASTSQPSTSPRTILTLSTSTPPSPSVPPALLVSPRPTRPSYPPRPRSTPCSSHRSCTKSPRRTSSAGRIDEPSKSGTPIVPSWTSGFVISSAMVSEESA
jgi:hypothetical protein